MSVNKVTIYTTTQYPYGFAGTNRVHQIAKGFKRCDVEATIIIAHPTETKSNIINKNRIGEYEGVAYKYISESTVRSSNKVIAFFYEVFCHIKLLIHFFNIGSKSDCCIIVGGGTFDFRVFFPFLAKLTSTKLFLEINEYPFVNQQGTLIRKIKEYFFYKFVVPNYDGFITISDPLAKLMKKNARPKAKIIKIPILSEFESNNVPIKSQFDKPYIIHAGSLIEAKDGIIGCLNSFAEASKQCDILYVIAGNLEKSPNKKQILDLIDQRKIRDKVKFVGVKTKDELISLYKNASLAIINKPNNTQNVYGFNTKISEYIAYKIPLILSDVGENSIYFKNFDTAFIVKANDVEKITSHIVYIINNKEEAGVIANNALELARKEFDNKINIEKILFSIRMNKSIQ